MKLISQSLVLVNQSKIVTCFACKILPYNVVRGSIAMKLGIQLGGFLVRGVGRGKTFLGSEDYKPIVSYLGKAVEKFNFVYTSNACSSRYGRRCKWL